MLYFSESKMLTKDEYKRFVDYSDEHFTDWYENKICYSVRGSDENYFVELWANGLVTFKEILT